LLRFDREGWIQLPKPRHRGRVVGITQATLPTYFCAPDQPLEIALSRLGKVSLKAVTTTDSALWNG